MHVSLHVILHDQKYIGYKLVFKITYNFKLAFMITSGYKLVFMLTSYKLVFIVMVNVPGGPTCSEEDDLKYQ